MDTKEIIIRTALERFLKFGYDKTSMRDIANQVGITKPAVYHHFESKQVLAESVIDYFEEKVRAWSRKNVLEVRTFDDFLHHLITSIPQYDHIEQVLLDLDKSDDFSMGFNDLCMALARDNDIIRQKIDHIFKKTESMQREIIEKAQENGVVRNDVDAATLSLAIHAIVEGMSFIHTFDRDNDFTEQANDIYKLLKTMVKPTREEQ